MSFVLRLELGITSVLHAWKHASKFMNINLSLKNVFNIFYFLIINIYLNFQAIQ